MPILEFDDKKPRIHPSCYVASNATIIGDVTLGEESNIWPNTVIRGDSNSINIGKRASIQDCCVIHADQNHPVVFGDRVLMGHGAIAHGCQVGSSVLIGIRSVVLSGAKIGDWSIVAAGSVVTEDTDIPPRSLALGTPAKVVRELGERDFAMITSGNEGYVHLGRTYRNKVDKTQTLS